MRSRPMGTKRIVFRNIRTEWTGGPKETNGGYGIYPVLCTDVLIEGCKAVGASDAGLYVGQSEDIVIGATARPGRMWRVSRSRTPPRPTSTKTWPPTTRAASWSSRCPTCPRRTAGTAASSTTRSGQQPRELRPQGQHRGDGPAGHRRHDHGQRPGRGLRQHDREEPDRGPLDRQLPDHRQADQGREIRPVLRGDLHSRQSLRGQRRQAGRRRWARCW